MKKRLWEHSLPAEQNEFSVSILDDTHIYIDGGIKAWGNADPRVSTTSVSCVPLKRSKQLPNVTHGDGRPAQADVG